MAKNGNGFFGAILLLFRLIFTAAFTLAVFVLLLGFVAFRCMHPAGSRMLAATLSSYPIVNVLPKIYFSADELDRIIAEQAYANEAEGAQAEGEDLSSEKTEMALGEAYANEKPPVTDDTLLLLDGLYVVPNPAEIPAAPPVSPEPEASEPEPTVLYGCVNGAVTTYLRLTPSLEARKALTIEPGTWCTVLGEEKQFYKIFYDNGEYYIYKDRLDVFEVPELPEGLTVPGLPEASAEEIEQMLSGENETGSEDDRIMCGFVDGITPYRTSPSFDEKQAGFLEAGAHFRILEEVSGFYKISTEENEIYVHTSKVTVYYEEIPATPIEPDEISSGATVPEL